MDMSIIECIEDEIEECTVAKNLISIFDVESLDNKVNDGDDDMYGVGIKSQDLKDQSSQQMMEIEESIFDAESLDNKVNDGDDDMYGVGIKTQDLTKGQSLHEMLVGATTSSERQAFHIYNDYAYKVGFSVRYSKVRHRCTSKGRGLCMRQFCCWKAGFKQDKGKNHKDHTNIDVRTGCKAFIQFHIDEDGKWIATRHVIEHNHALCSPSKRHLLPSHREVSEEDILFVKQLRESGIGVADAYRVLKKQVGGSPSLGYGLRDVYNKLNQMKDRTFDGGDAHSASIPSVAY